MSNERSRIVGRHPAISRVRSVLQRVASSDVPVFLEGEEGTGKALMARTLHEYSGCRGPFVHLAVGTLEAHEAHSVILGGDFDDYGHRIRRLRGVLQTANRGTLYVDGVDQLAEPLLTRVLRAAQTGEFRPFGAAVVRRSNFRAVLSVTNASRFVPVDRHITQTMLERTGAIPLKLPPLRERVCDIPLLTEHFLAMRGAERSWAWKSLPRTVRTRCLQYPWPGNVGQLRRVIGAALAVAGTHTLSLDALTLILDQRSGVESVSAESQFLAVLRAAGAKRHGHDDSSAENAGSDPELTSPRTQIWGRPWFSGR